MAMQTLPDKAAVWQDREIRALELRRGEVLIDSINSVEDTKGNNTGERGSLVVTNLRVMWVSHKHSRTNLSVGYATILGISIKKANSRLRGSTQALYIMTKFQTSRFEFIFTSLVKNSPRLFTTVQAVMRAYETSKLYRDLKLRGSIVRDMQLVMLPHEQVYNKISGVWNLSSDQGNLGTFFITNIRLVWHANLAQNFNVSIPYMQMKVIRIRDSKFGRALVIETSQKSGGYILGFRVDPVDAVDAVFEEVANLHQVFSRCPVFGVDFSVEDRPAPLEQRHVPRQEDDVTITDDGDAELDAIAAYYADGHKTDERDIVFNDSLGLAVELPPSSTTLDMLWRVV